MTENVKCPECKLVNWGTAQNCQRCHASLAEVPFSYHAIYRDQTVETASNKDEQIIKEFQIRRRRQSLLLIPLVPVVLVCVSLRGNQAGSIGGFGTTTLLLISVLVVIGALIFSFQNWRCPACDTYLGKRNNPGACFKCGARLR